MINKYFYNTVLCQAFSPCGQYLIAGNIYGQLGLFDLSNVFNPDIALLSPDFNRVKFVYTLDSKKPICSLITIKKMFVVGTSNEISAWEWRATYKKELCKPLWTIDIRPQSLIENCDINSLWFSEEEEKLYAGCGDNKIYVYNLEERKLLNIYEGHSDFVHCVHGKGQQLISAGEDGSVLIWDTRTKKFYNKIEPYNNTKVARPDIGKWVGAAALGSDWIICGGGPRLSLWHSRSLDAVTVFDIPDNGIHVSFFHDDCIFAGGTSKHFYQLSYSGEVRVELPVSSSTVYSAIVRTAPRNVLCVAGSSPEIDLCTTFNYIDQVLHFRNE